MRLHSNSTIGIFHIAFTLLMATLFMSARCLSESDPHLPKRPFTVADSIGMMHLVDPHERDVPSKAPKYSPNGKRFIVVTETGDLTTNFRKYSLLLFDANDTTQKPRELVVRNSSSNRDGILLARWLDDETIAFVGESPGEVPQVYLVDCGSRKLSKLTSDQSGVVAYDISRDRNTVAYYAEWRGDPVDAAMREQHGFVVTRETLTDLLYSSWLNPRDYYILNVLDRSTGQLRAVRETPFVVNPMALSILISPDGQFAITQEPPPVVNPLWEGYEDQMINWPARVHQDRNNSLMQAMLVNLPTAEIRPLLDAPMSFGIGNFEWLSNHTVVLGCAYLPLSNVNANAAEVAKRKQFAALVEVDVPNLELRRISDIPPGEYWSVEMKGISGGIVVNRVRLVPGKTSEPLEAMQFTRTSTGWTHALYHSSEALGSPTILISQAIDRRPVLMVTNNETKESAVLFDPNPQLDNFQFGKVEVIHWTGKRKEPLVGGLVYPVNYTPGKRYPLVIQTHGFSPQAFLVDGPFTTAMAAQELASRGIMVLQLGEGPLYEHSEDTPDFGPANMIQLESAVDYLDDRGLIDPKRVGLVGFSMTGFAVRYALMFSKYNFAAATSAEGNDYGYWTYVLLRNLATFPAQVEAIYGGPPWDGNWKPWLEQSISFNYDKIHTPLRLESDSNPGAVLNEWENFTALKRMDRPVELIFLPHGEHPVVKPWDRMASQGGNVDWMSFWLTGYEDPDPEKLDQYQRWHRLKEQHEADLRKCTDLENSKGLSAR